jgi:hypothetical protein
MPTIADDFNRTDNATLGTATVGGVSQGWSWTEVQGDIDIVSNTARAAAAATSSARAESDLGTTDHYAEVDVTSTNNGCGPCVRYAAAATTYYLWYVDSFDRVASVIAGAFSQVGTINNNASGLHRLSISGTTIEGFIGGVSQGTITDSAITTGTRTGIRSDDTISIMTSFGAGDLGAAAAASRPIFRRSTRFFTRRF